MTKQIARVREKGDITIPKLIRKQINLEVGDYLWIEPKDDSLIIRKVKS